MARLFSSGFELQSVTAAVEWQTITNSPFIETVPTNVRSGNASLGCNTAATTASVTHQYAAAGGDTNNHFYRMYIKMLVIPDGNCTIMQTRDTAAAVNVAGLQLNSDGTVTLRDTGNNTDIGSASTKALVRGTWHRLELEYQYHATTPTVIGYIDGESFASGTLTNLGNNNPNQFQVGVISSRTTNLRFDDVAINDSTGSFQNGLPGSGRIFHLKPNAAGDNNAWAGGVGTDYTAVDEVTPDDATSYLTSDTTGELFDANIDSPPGWLKGTDTITVLSVGFRAAEDAAASSNSFKLRIMASSGGTVEESASFIPSSTTFRTNGNAAPFVYQLTLYDLPGASTTAYTKADLETTQIGLNHDAGSGTSDSQVSTIWLLVETSVEFTPVGFRQNVLRPSIFAPGRAR